VREFRAKAIINAPAAEVFKTITDPKAYPRFDPNCAKVAGHIEKGRSIVMFSRHKQAGSERMRVRELFPDEVMVWEFVLPLNLLKRVRTFKVIAKDDQTTEFQMIEIQSGYLVDFLVNRLADRNLIFEQFARGLKKFMESRP
jgi:uncharacterized protein YndB with AHSA1/START domain